MRTRQMTLVLAALVGVAAILGCNQNSGTTAKSGKKSSAARKESSDSDARTADNDESPATEDVADRDDAKAKSAPAETELAANTPPKPRREPEPKETPPAEPKAVETPAQAEPLTAADAQELGAVMPQVSLTQGHTEACRVKVGDPLPDWQLPDLENAEQSLAKLLGKKLTVVVFWSGNKPTVLEELSDLGPDVLKQFAKNGVAVVGINSGDDPQLARELVKQAGAEFPNLSDPKGEALGQVVATGRVPRTYLVDASGKVVWFDMEYSRTTRRELKQAIAYQLTH